MTEKRYCPATGQFEDHFSGTCCDDPMMHIKPVEGIMAAYRQMAVMRDAVMRATGEWTEAMSLLELAEQLITETDKWDDPAWMARKERFEGRLRALR